MDSVSSAELLTFDEMCEKVKKNGNVLQVMMLERMLQDYGNQFLTDTQATTLLETMVLYLD